MTARHLALSPQRKSGLGTRSGPVGPHDGWLPGLPPELTGRTIEAMSRGDARRLRHPMFVKPPTDKRFEAGVYSDGTRLPGPDKLPAQTPVHVSEIVTCTCEYRLFALDGEVHAASRYAVFGHLDVAPIHADPDRDAALGFAEDLLGAVADSLPSAVVVDVGLITPPDRACGCRECRPCRFGGVWSITSQWRG